ncbi:flavin-dependent oxidoreductase [Sneathiella chinensis]|uniref:Flavin-dependent oxidoreductase n=1 Tax=Sneathiella chinensis TaxID=349750 RepID=A0ABQ5U668_9PROT|nr:flavin-dependent oxidoreductase [Sneathiella chinensis]GLQ07276.1 flavin-dependent oxidoreductase [Sneathiella chinensis]
MPEGIIAGGGLVGLTLALALHEQGIKVRVFETVPEIKPLGVGINLLPHSVRNLARLGLMAELDKVAIRTSSLGYYSEDGKEIWKEPRGIEAGYEVPQFSIHRGDFHMILLNAVKERLGEDAVVTDWRLDRFEQNADQVTAFFTNHAGDRPQGSVTADFLVGADGINSRLRRIFYPDEGPPHYSGQMLWRGVTEMPPYLDGRSMFMAGHNDVKLVAYPIRAESARRGLTYINWIAERRIPSDLNAHQADWNQTGGLEEFADAFKDWNLGWLDIHALFQNALSVHRFPMIDRNPIPKWTFGRVTLMGDAAHAMYPNGSNGVSQGVLDAMTFTELMASGLDVPEVLAEYEAVRLEPTKKIQLANRETGPEKVMQMVRDTCGGQCGDRHTCIAPEVLEDVATAYKKTGRVRQGKPERAGRPYRLEKSGAGAERLSAPARLVFGWSRPTCRFCRC